MRIKSLLIYFAIFLFPLFFLPTTQEFFITNKLYFLAGISLLLLLTSCFEFVFSRRFAFRRKPYDVPVLLFILAAALSVLLSSPNKVQAILNPNFGLLMIFSLGIWYYYTGRFAEIKIIKKVAYLSTFLLSIVAIIYFFSPLKNANLPTSLQFLKNVYFTPIGTQLDLIVYLGFFIIFTVFDLLKNGKDKVIVSFTLVFNILAFLLTGYTIFKSGQLILPPLNISWFAAVETLKNPVTALFGVGIDNFAAIFTRVKDLSYNQSNLWQINSFAVGSSAILHIMTEAGLLGLFAFGLIFYKSLTLYLKPEKRSEKQIFWSFGYVLLVLLFLPVSLISFFLFFTIVAFIDAGEKEKEYELNLSSVVPVYVVLGLILFPLVLIGLTAYFLSRTYLAEYYFKQSLNAVTRNSLRDLYDNQRKAIIINPYLERFRINFSQTNLIIANNIAASTKSKTLSDQDKQMISQAIQAAISEAKAALTLNSQKASNWESLAIIYRNILAVVQGADVWTVSSYQRAIVLDPNNPIYRLNLGGVYYSLTNYDQAQSLFQQATALKPDWANAHYNLAWASYQKKDYQTATSEMGTVLALIDPNKDKSDYDKAKKDLDDFKQKLAKSEEEATKSGKLNLPQPPTPSISPRINLPQNASPEAK